MDLGLKEEVVLIVGGARGIGFATAQELVAAGAKVAIADIDGTAAKASAEKLAKEAGVSARGYRMDVTSPDEVTSVLDAVGEDLGRIRGLVIAAAVLDDKQFLESKSSDWKRMIDVCLYGPMNVLHAALPRMIQNGGGRVVCLATDAARVGQARLAYYAAAKAGVIALVKSVAQEVGRHGITVNVVSPGATNTELRREREDRTRAEIGDAAYTKRVEKVERMYPLRRIGEPHDHSAMISLLLSNRASWVTGQVFSINVVSVMP